MNARIYRGADFRAKSLRGLTIDMPRDGGAGKPHDFMRIDQLQAVFSAFAGGERPSEPRPAARQGRPAVRSAPEPFGEGSREELSQKPLPYCDIRVLQDAARHAARHAEALAVLADRASDAGLRGHLSALAEACAEETILLRRLIDEALGAKGAIA